MHSEQQKECQSTHEKMETSIYMKGEDAKNGLYSVADEDDLTIPTKNYKTERTDEENLKDQNITSSNTRSILTH